VGYLTVVYSITDPIVILRNADAREALKVMMKPLYDQIQLKRCLKFWLAFVNSYIMLLRHEHLASPLLLLRNT